MGTILRQVNTPVLGIVVLTAFACGARPSAEVQHAKMALLAATEAEAGTYAPDELTAAHEAERQFEAELSAQEARWFGSYAKAGQLALAFSDAAERAEREAIAGKERVRSETTAIIAEANTIVDDARRVLEQARQARTSLDVDATVTELEGLEITLMKADDKVRAGRYADAKNEAEAARTIALELKTTLEEAIAPRG